eukprot:2512535-Rhodomonas_salina.2
MAKREDSSCMARYAWQNACDRAREDGWEDGWEHARMGQVDSWESGGGGGRGREGEMTGESDKE